MKKLFVGFVSLLLLCACSHAEIEKEGDVQKNDRAQQTKERLDITVRFSFFNLRGVDKVTYTPPQPSGPPSFTIYEQGAPLYWAQVWAEMRTSSGMPVTSSNRIQFTLRDVFVIQNQYSSPFGAADVDIIECQPYAYSQNMPIIRSTTTYVDLASIKLSPDYLNSEYDVHWNFEGMPLKNQPGEVKPPIDPHENQISVQWNGTSWDIVAQYPVASTLIVVGAGPQTSGYEWTMNSGETLIHTGNTDPGFSISAIMPKSDSKYNYVFI